MKTTNFLNKMFWLILAVGLTTVMFNSCKEDEDPTITVTSVSLDTTNLTLTKGQRFHLRATIQPDNATERTTTYKSSNLSVATVSAIGWITAENIGQATITATAGGKSATCVVTVVESTIDVTSITFNKSTLSLTVGSNETLTATVLPDNATNKTVTWTSDNTNVATVVNGTVTARASGTATIVASVGDKTTSCVVTVSGAAVPVITITTQPAINSTFTQGSISGSISVAASVTEGATLSYQWYSNTSNSNTGGSAISGATSANFIIPTTLTVGSYYYFCQVSATGGASSMRSNMAAVTVNSASLFCSGDGTQGNPYTICTPAQLDAVRSNLSAHYKLANNIDLTSYLAPSGTGYSKWSAAGWEPIGGNFTGSFDGAGYKITGLWISRSSVSNIGLFANVGNGGKVQNLGVEVATSGIIGSTSSVGGIAGSASGNNCIINCYVIGTISGGSNVGGVVGYLANGSIANCYAIGTISSSNSHAGGVVGNVYGGNISCSITNCYSTGAVSGAGHVGGVAGSVDRGSLTNCYATGTVSSSNYAGGVVGFVHSGIVTNCVALNPNVTSNRYAGRISAATNSTTLSNNWARSNMTLTVGQQHLALYNGVDCVAIPMVSWWTTFSPNGPGWSSSTWYFTSGLLPVLQWQRQR